MLAELFANHPEIVAVVIAALGFLVAGVLSHLVERWLLALERLLRRRAPERVEHVNFRAPRQGLRAVVYYGTLILFMLVALQTLGISLLRGWLEALLAYVPQLILGGLIILSGYLLGVIARNVVAGLMGSGSDHLIPRLAQALVVTAAVLTGLAQTAIDVSFISQIIVIIVGLFFGGLSLAFALGSRQLVENLLARRAIERYRIGDRVRLGDTEGRIIEILGTAVVLENADGLVTVPTSRFMEAAVVLLNDTEAEDTGG